MARGRLHATHALAKAGGTIDGIAQKALGEPCTVSAVQQFYSAANHCE